MYTRTYTLTYAKIDPARVVGLVILFDRPDMQGWNRSWSEESPAFQRGALNDMPVFRSLQTSRPVVVAGKKNWP